MEAIAKGEEVCEHVCMFYACACMCVVLFQSTLTGS